MPVRSNVRLSTDRSLTLIHGCNGEVFAADQRLILRLNRSRAVHERGDGPLLGALVTITRRKVDAVTKALSKPAIVVAPISTN